MDQNQLFVMNSTENMHLNDDTFPSSDDDEQTSQIIENDPTGRFGKYNEEIGKGAYKSVYRGYDKESGCEVAWNVFQLMNVPENERRRAKQEIAILKSVKHKNIISFIHSWQSKSKKEIVFITEIVNGGSLKNYMKRITRPKLKVIRYWCKQILEGLDYLHSQKIIHRDLKCENLLIDTNNNELKIGDLGLSIQLSSDFTSSVLGTPEFMAPEIYEGNYDTKIDIYAFGMCVLEMVTGMKPFCECKGGTGQVIKKVMEAQKPQSIDAIQNERIKNIILECLQPADKRPTAVQLLNKYFLSQNNDEDNQPVSVNESLLLQLTGDSKNPSFLKWNQSKHTASSNKGHNHNTNNINNPSITNQTNKNIISQTMNELNPIFMKQSEVRNSQQQNKLSTETDEELSIEQQFNKQYKEYYLTQNDESLLDLERRQEKEMQLLMLLHKQQKQDFSNKCQPTVLQGSGFLSSKSSLSMYFDDKEGSQQSQHQLHQQYQFHQLYQLQQLQQLQSLQQQQTQPVHPIAEASGSSSDPDRQLSTKQSILDQQQQKCQFLTNVVLSLDPPQSEKSIQA